MSKSCYMHFCPKGAKIDNETNHGTPPIKINGTEIAEVNETKFLGVIIDNQLSWKPHINALIKKLKCCTGQLNRIKKNYTTFAI